MGKGIRKAISVLLVAVVLFASAPLAGFVGLDLPEINLFSRKAEAATSGTCGEPVEEEIISKNTVLTDEKTGIGVEINGDDYDGETKVVEGISVEAEIRNPSAATIKYGDTIVLHADLNVALPNNWHVEWTSSNNSFGCAVSADGLTCTITPSKSGDTTFTATVYDADGNVVSADEQTMTSKAGFFDKIRAFFKKIFGLTKTIPELYKGIF